MGHSPRHTLSRAAPCGAVGGQGPVTRVQRPLEIKACLCHAHEVCLAEAEGYKPGLVALEQQLAPFTGLPPGKRLLCWEPHTWGVRAISLLRKRALFGLKLATLAQHLHNGEQFSRTITLYLDLHGDFKTRTHDYKLGDFTGYCGCWKNPTI